MATLPEPTQKLVAVLKTQTEEGKRRWTRGSSDTEFVFHHESGSVVILSLESDGTAPFALRILDSNGILEESYTSADDEEDVLDGLYEAARESTASRHRVVESLLDDLEKPPGVRLGEKMARTVEKVTNTKGVEAKAAVIKPLLRARIEELRESGDVETTWPDLVAPFPSGGGVRNGLTQAFRELLADKEIDCSVTPEPGPGEGFGGGKVIRFH